jgi:hypothetical protein
MDGVTFLYKLRMLLKLYMYGWMPSRRVVLCGIMIEFLVQ